MNFKGFIRIVWLCLFFLAGCQRSDDLLTSYWDNRIQNNQYTIYALDYFDMPYTSTQVTSLEIDYYADPNGVPLFQYKGKDYYHPVNIAQKVFPLINSYILTQTRIYLSRAEQFIQVLIDSSNLYKGARFYPYQFDYPVHNISSQVLFHPWYSGMAQGHLLTALCRLYQVTQNEKYAELAHETFQSYFHFYDSEDPWFMIIDPNCYVWIEEYPMLPTARTLNGFIFSIYGLYDYYWTFQSESCYVLLQQTITTIQQYISDFRNPGSSSYYCLKHHYIDPFYHRIHINQLRMLYKMTQDDYFNAMADSLYADYQSD